jgi:hypothetical protein
VQATLAVAATCVAGPTDPARCVVRLQRSDGAVAGEAAVLVVQRFDSFGNAVAAADGPLRAEAAGPGAMLTEARGSPDLSCRGFPEIRIECDGPD